jgi:hypothetical protein
MLPHLPGALVKLPILLIVALALANATGENLHFLPVIPRAHFTPACGFRVIYRNGIQTVISESPRLPQA